MQDMRRVGDVRRARKPRGLVDHDEALVHKAAAVAPRCEALQVSKETDYRTNETYIRDL